MTTLRPLTGTEKEILQVSLDRHRDAVVWKAQGLSDEDLRRPMVPSGSSVLGLIKHLANVEFTWFCETFGRPVEQNGIDENDPESDLRIGPDETTADILAFYARSRAASDSVITDFNLNDVGTSWHGESVSLRWVCVHMIEETARHAGHLDLIVEQLDGRTGD